MTYASFIYIISLYLDALGKSRLYYSRGRRFSRIAYNANRAAAIFIIDWYGYRRSKYRPWSRWYESHERQKFDCMKLHTTIFQFPQCRHPEWVRDFASWLIASVRGLLERFRVDIFSRWWAATALHGMLSLGRETPAILPASPSSQKHVRHLPCISSTILLFIWEVLHYYILLLYILRLSLRRLSL